MGTVIIRVDESLEETLRKLKEQAKREISNLFGFDIKIEGTVVSKIAAAKLNGSNILNFKVRKVGLNEGYIELL